MKVRHPANSSYAFSCTDTMVTGDFLHECAPLSSLPDRAAVAVGGPAQLPLTHQIAAFRTLAGSRVAERLLTMISALAA